jgi:hypothetical protein
VSSSRPTEEDTSDPLAGWKTLRIDGAFDLTFPGDSTHELQDDETMFVIRLSTEPATEVLVGRFELPDPAARGRARMAALEGEVRRFFEKCWRAEGNYVTEQKPDGFVTQGVAFVDGDDRVCVARAYADFVGERYFLIHWNGPPALARTTVIRIFETFEPHARAD